MGTELRQSSFDFSAKALYLERARSKIGRDSHPGFGSAQMQLFALRSTQPDGDAGTSPARLWWGVGSLRFCGVQQSGSGLHCTAIDRACGCEGICRWGYSRLTCRRQGMEAVLAAE